MNIKKMFFESIGKAFTPNFARAHLDRYITKAGMTEVPYSLFGVLFHLSWITTLIIYFSLIYPIIHSKEQWVFFISTFVLWALVQGVIILIIMSCIYFYLDLRIFKRTKDIERILPHFLKYVSEDLRAGMPFDKALWEAIRPEFGVLANEMNLVAKRAMTGQDVDQALNEFAEKYDSPMLKRTFTLIIEAIRGGGRIADIIDKIEEQLRETKELKQEMIATNTTYMVFITFIIVGVAPALFGLSYSLLLVLKNISSRLQMTTAHAASLPLDFSGVSIQPENFVMFSMLALAIISIFSSMIISIIKNGNIKGGLKYIPFFTVASLGMYLLLKSLFAVLFGNLI